MTIWTTQTWVARAPEHVLELLTELDAISRWAPIPLELYVPPSHGGRELERALA